MNQGTQGPDIPRKGRLKVIREKSGPNVYLFYQGRKGELKMNTRSFLHPELAKKTPEELDGMEVEFDIESGNPRHIRRPGTPSPARPPEGRPAPQPRTAAGPSQGSGGRGFHNPYNFIPAPPRNTGDPELGDRIPPGHHRYHPDRWSGRITVSMKVVTPLLILDAHRSAEIGKNHRVYPVRRDAEGNPLVPATSVRGMLRAAYEAVTNSRFGVFPGHDGRLGYRMAAGKGLCMVPARVEGGGLRLLTGTSRIAPNGRPQGNLMYAAWLPMYDMNSERRAPWALRYKDGSEPRHGDEVECWVRKYRYSRGNVVFYFWRVVDLARPGELPQQASRSDSIPPPGPCCQPLDEELRIRGWVCITNRNIDRKHDERVFFHDEAQSGPPVVVPLTRELTSQWKDLIRNCQEIHGEELKRGVPGPPAMKNSVWSRHVTEEGAERIRELREGDLCHALVEKQGDRVEVRGLYPVMISRDLYELAPEVLLHESLRPATDISQLSPADRVFGWVSQHGKGAFRGCLRVGRVRPQGDGRQMVEEFREPRPLAILGQPKPSQARFYLLDEGAQPWGNEEVKERGTAYRRGQSLRGRKVYPHHGSFVENEAFRAGRVQDDQNRSIRGWVKPGAEFRFDLDVRNLSDVELGALLWLLRLPEGHFHRLGGGKPLGFGSVRLDVKELELGTGDAWRRFYRDMGRGGLAGEGVILAVGDAAFGRCVEAFRKAVGRCHGGERFEQVGFIRAFLNASAGFGDGLPVHYPRATPEPDPEGKNYEWFGWNERGEGGAHRSLGPLEDGDPGGLPFPPPADRKDRGIRGRRG